MYGDFILLTSDEGATTAERLAFDDTAARNEPSLQSFRCSMYLATCVRLMRLPGMPHAPSTCEEA